MDVNKTEPQNGKPKTAGKKDATVKKKKRSLSIVVHLLLALLFCVILVAGAYWGLNLYTHHGEEIKVPDVSGLKPENAIRRLEVMGLKADIEDSVYVKSLPPFVVYDQSIKAGELVKKGRTLHLIINSGSAPRLILPDIADNSSLREAQVQLASLGLRHVDVELMKGEKDWVYRVKCNGHDVGAGASIGVDDRIILVVGDGTYYDDYMEVDEYGGDSLSLEYEDNETF